MPVFYCEPTIAAQAQHSSVLFTEYCTATVFHNQRACAIGGMSFTRLLDPEWCEIGRIKFTAQSAALCRDVGKVENFAVLPLPQYI